MASDHRYEKRRQSCEVLLRSDSGGKEFLDVSVNVECPECPEDVEAGILVINWESTGCARRSDGEYIHGGDWMAKCPKCGFRAVVGVYEEGA